MLSCFLPNLIHNVNKILGKQKSSQEKDDTDRFIEESTIGAIEDILMVESSQTLAGKELGPNFAAIGLPSSLDDTSNAVTNNESEEFDLSLDDVDDEELDAYIMNESEVKRKSCLWLKHNAAYLEQQKGELF